MMFATPPMRAFSASVVGNDATAGLPSPSAFLGLAGAALRSLDVDPWSVRVVPILHRVDVSEGRTRGHMVKNERGNDPFIKVLEIPETMIADVVFSMIVILDDAHAPRRLDPREIADSFVGRRFAGADMFCLGARGVIEIDAGLRGLGRIPSGRALIPAFGRGPMPVALRSLNEFAALADTLHPVEPHPGRGWLVPVPVGYELLETPVPGRRGSRDATIPHAFVESLTGIGELVSVRSPRMRQALSIGQDGLWGYDRTPERILFSRFYRNPAPGANPDTRLTEVRELLEEEAGSTTINAS